jgi:hypothetical protein
MTECGWLAALLLPELLPCYSRLVAINEGRNLTVQIRKGCLTSFVTVILGGSTELVALSVMHNASLDGHWHQGALAEILPTVMAGLGSVAERQLFSANQ